MKKLLLLPLVISVILLACNKSTDPFVKEKITGVSQKGPFLNGSSLTAFELDENFSQTGKSFNTQIADNLGSFEITNISVMTQYVKLKADGFYFNEIKNENSVSPISLYALSDLSDKTTVNINLLSTLEVARVEYLLSNGSSFADAKRQAQHEILAMFFIQNPDISESELLDISQDGAGNAMLLAMSLILQGTRTEAELSQLIADISSDIRTDGILNSQTLGSALLNGATLITPPQVRINIEEKYAALGITTVIPDFEYYIQQFIDLCPYTITEQIEYPFMIQVNYLPGEKKNLWADTIFDVASSVQYAIGAHLPLGTSLKVVVKPTAGYAEWLWAFDGPGDWDMENYFPDSQIVSINGTGTHASIKFHVNGSSSLDFVFYENGALTPTRIKTIQW